jgi:16S rRNA processing protein RimM
LLLEAYRFHKNMVLLKFKGINNLDEALTLNQYEVQIPENETYPLPADHYYHYQLIGAKVYSPTGTYLGELKEVLTCPVNDVWVIKNDVKEILVPAVKKFIPLVDLELKKIIIDIPSEWQNED